MSDNHLPLVSVVFITYNRPHTLVATYETFINIVDYPRSCLELILADDCSAAHYRSILDQIPFDIRLHNAKNMGLGSTSNSAIKAANGKYILYLQDDWILTHRASVLREAVTVLEGVPEIGIVHLRNWGEGIASESKNVNGVEFEILASTAPDGAPSRTYSDNPHLKRCDFHEKVGWYKEGVPMTKMEDAMNASVSAQNTYQSSRLLGPLPFIHIGDRYSFNPGRRRMIVRQAIERLPGGKLVLRSLSSLRRYSRQIRGREGM